MVLGDVQAAERQKAGCWLGGGNHSHWGAGAAVYPKHPEIPVPLVNHIHISSQRGSRAASGVTGLPSSGLGSFCGRCGSRVRCTL